MIYHLMWTIFNVLQQERGEQESFKIPRIEQKVIFSNSMFFMLSFFVNLVEKWVISFSLISITVWLFSVKEIYLPSSMAILLFTKYQTTNSVFFHLNFRFLMLQAMNLGGHMDHTRLILHKRLEICKLIFLFVLDFLFFFLFSDI